MPHSVRGGGFLILGILTLALASAQAWDKDYRDDALKVTKVVEEFIARHDVSGSDLEKVHQIIALMHDKFLFVRVDRSRLGRWIQDSSRADQFEADLKRTKDNLARLYEKRKSQLLTETDVRKRDEWQQAVFYGEHDLWVYRNVVQKKDILPDDMPFAVSGAEAVEFGISDGCTTAAKTFIVLAHAAGLSETRFVATGNVPDYSKACPLINKPRQPDVTINGHFFALAKIEGRWALVNCTYFDPYADEEAGRYEIFFRLDGQDVSPEMLKLRILRIPSFQREGTPPPPNRLYVIALGKNSQDDMDIENYRALMNLSVSGDRDCSDCKYATFR